MQIRFRIIGVGGGEHGERKKDPINVRGSFGTLPEKFRAEEKDSGKKNLGFMGEGRWSCDSREDPADGSEKSSAAGKGFKFCVDATTSIHERTDSAKVI